MSISVVTDIGYELDSSDSAVKRIVVEETGDVPSGGTEPSAGTVDELLSDEAAGWLTPMEYYSSGTGALSSVAPGEEGYLRDTGTSVSETTRYFWLDDLKNWCRYSVYNDTYSSQQFILNVWNGRDGWIPVHEYLSGIDATPPSYPPEDRYGISIVQRQFLRNEKHHIVQHRGLRTPVYKAIYRHVTGMAMPDGIVTPSYDQYVRTEEQVREPAFLQVIQAIRLQKAERYTVNSDDTFQTVRWNSIYVETKGNPDAAAYAQTNFRAAVPAGAPCIWRLPTGEIALCTKLQWNSDDGTPYIYVKAAEGGFVKLYVSDWAKMDVTELNMVGPDTQAANFVNEICAGFFGTGSGKTIETDWLREYSPTVDTSLYMSSVTDSRSMLDSSLMFEQHNINKENSLKCSFTVNRPVATTNDRNDPDYAKKW